MEVVSWEFKVGLMLKKPINITHHTKDKTYDHFSGCRKMDNFLFLNLYGNAKRPRKTK